MQLEREVEVTERKKKVLVVGGGTAGLTIQSCLSENFDVIVLEQSSQSAMPFIYELPISVGLLFSSYNKYVEKFDFPALGKRLIPFFQSNCLGGASVINGSVHVVGSDNVWKGILERFNLCPEVFPKLYESLFDTKVKKNKISLKKQSPDELDYAFYKAMGAHSVGVGESEFFNKASCGPIVNTVKYLRRSSVLDLISSGAKKIKFSGRVDDIEIKNNSVSGVWVGGQLVEADIVVLSAGVIGSNQLISKLLRKLNDNRLPLLKDRVIFDHTNLRINVRSRKKIFCLNQLALPLFQRIPFILKSIRRLLSISRGSGASSAANIDLYGEGRISLRLNLLRLHENGRLGSAGRLFDNSDSGFSISLTQVNPRSKGFLNVEGNIDPGYLTSRYDVQFLVDALMYTLKILKTRPLSDYVGEISDLEAILKDPEAYVRENFYSGYHLIGGAADLIDHEFKIAGIDGLYVCDASVLSEYPSSNIHSSVVILAKAFSQKIINREILNQG